MQTLKNFFLNLTTPFRRRLTTRILTSFLLMVLLSLSVAIAGIYYTTQASSKLVSLLEQDQKITSLIFSMQRAVEQQNSNMRAYVVHTTDDIIKQDLDRTTLDYALSDGELKELLKQLKLPTDKYETVEKEALNYNEAVQIVRQVNPDEFPDAAAFLWERTGPIVKDRLVRALDALLGDYRRLSAQQIDDARNQGGNVLIVALLLVLMAALLGVFVSSVITRSVIAPLRELAGVARDIRQGNLDVKLPVLRAEDEISDLVGAMGSMAENLRISRQEQETLLEDARKRNKELTALNRVASTIGLSLDLDSVLHEALDQLLKIADMEHGSLFLMEADEQSLRLAAWHNQSDEYLRHYNRVGLGEQITGMVARTGEVTMLENPMLDPRLNHDYLRTETHKIFYLGIPLKSKGKVVGVANLTSTTIQKLEPRYLVLLSAIGNQIGIAVDNARLYQKASELAAVDERNRLARDLHDSVTQTLFSITLTAESIKAMLVKKPEKVEGQVDRLQNLARGALAEMRSLIFQLRPAALQEQGLVAALDKHIAVMKAKDLYKVEFNVVDERRLSDDHEQTLYRIAQEAFNNINKHSQAKHVWIDLKFTDEYVTLTIEDDGLGFDAGTELARRNRSSLGLISMRERTELAGGTYTINSTPGNGTNVFVYIPLDIAPRPVGMGINS